MDQVHTKYIRLHRVTSNKYDVYFIPNGIQLGEFITGDDGYFYFFSKSNGAYQDYVLIELGEQLKLKNKEVDEHILKLTQNFRDRQLGINKRSK